jgi:capsular exopolysaccharide synthesis family protein
VANLGVSMAQNERSVLLVDTDLRRPMLHTMFRQPNSPGLSSYLAGDALLEAIVQKTAIPNLSIVASGPMPPNPAELLASRRMRDFVGTLSERFDVIVFDSPPVLAVSDACTLAALADGVLLIVGSGATPQANLRRTKEQILAVQGRIIGAVVNRFDASASGYSKRYYDTYDGYYTRGAKAK